MMKKKVALVLGGGAGRGLAHIGVIDALIKAGIMPDLVVGCSIGALVGAAFALSGGIDDITKKMKGYFGGHIFKKLRMDFFKQISKSEQYGLFDTVSTFVKRGLLMESSLTNESFISKDAFQANIDHFITNSKFEETKIPFICVAVDLVSSKEVILKEGSLREAVAASSAIPGIFPPVRKGSMILSDGGWLDQIPVSAARKAGADIIIASSIQEDLSENKTFQTAMEIFMRASDITKDTLSLVISKDSDITIKPDVGSINWADFESVDQCITKGSQAAKDALPYIEAAINKKTKFRRISNGFKNLWRSK